MKCLMISTSVFSVSILLFECNVIDCKLKSKRYTEVLSTRSLMGQSGKQELIVSCRGSVLLPLTCHCSANWKTPYSCNPANLALC